MIAPGFERLDRALESRPWIEAVGRVAKVVGLVIESNGPNEPIGHLCLVDTERGAVSAEVVGFRDGNCLLLPLGEVTGVRAGCRVRATGKPFQVPVGPELLGRVLDGLGQPMDGRPLPPSSGCVTVSAHPPDAMTRNLISRPLETGVRAIDALLTIGEGQRMGIFSGSGVGKSTLLGMIARNCQADVNVICLVGERGREVREFIENDLGPKGLGRSIVVCATSDQPALVRIKAAFTATAIAEYFRDRGQRVLLMMDSVTRFATAQREVGLAVGEPPSTRGYTPSVFSLLPKLMERAGNGSKGSITGLYTVLVEADDNNEPIGDAVRAILDGHIVLDRKLTSRGHYPPIDVLRSLSRTMPMVVGDEQLKSANDLRDNLAAYADVEDLVMIGAYKEGSNPTADRAIRLKPGIDAFLRQEKAKASTVNQTLQDLAGALGG